MKKNDKLVVVLGVIILVLASIGVYYWAPPEEGLEEADIDELLSVSGNLKDMLPTAISVADSNPFYALIATPIACNYDKEGEQSVIPLYVKSFEEPSDAVERVEKEQIMKIADEIVTPKMNVKDLSLEFAKKYWKTSKAALILEDSMEGYNLGIAATPIASYLSIPVIVTDEIDQEVIDVLEDLDVEYTIICGENLEGGVGKVFELDDLDEIMEVTKAILYDRFDEINYITLANPLDTSKAIVVKEDGKEVYEEYNFEGTITSTAVTASQAMGILKGVLFGPPMTAYHLFDIPDDYKYARLTIEARNLVDQDVEETGSMLQPSLLSPDGEVLAYMFTSGGLPERNANGGITTDKVVWDTIIYDQPGEYAISVAGKIVGSKTADYEVDLKIEKLENAIVPQMPGLSSIAPYVTAYRQGFVFAKPNFTFVADESILPDLSSDEAGVAYPASNPELIDDVNKHVFKIHEELNDILADLRDIDLEEDDGLELLKNSYEEDPVYIALVGDATMLPHYYHYDTPDANSLQYGWDVASDFIYGNIDPVARDDDVSVYSDDVFVTKPYEENYPFQENIVGRITGWDVQDASALIARTIFYDEILDNMENQEWKETAVVQTGSGTDFQRIPVIDLIRRLIPSIHELPIKWPTGESHQQNLIIQKSLKPGGFEIRSTENTKSMRKGVSDKVLQDINRMGILNLIFFPKIRAKWLVGESSNNPPTGEVDQTESNFIFSFGHGQPMGFSHGDVQTESIGFRPVIANNLLNRAFFGLLPSLGPGLGNVGGYQVRYVSDMELGPGVMFVESCYIGRIDGFPSKCVLNQAYLHAGLNSFIASSRGSPGPGYLEARPRPVGFGLAEWIKHNLGNAEQPAHFSALYAQNMFLDLNENDVDIGTAFRNSRNLFMEDADSEFYWTPPLSLDIQTVADQELFENNLKLTSETGDLRVMEKKYTCFMEYNLFGDPMFNPYEPANEG